MSRDGIRYVAGVRAMEEKTFDVIKQQVSLDTKSISIDEFNKLFEAK